jgi:hypothetical protein
VIKQCLKLSKHWARDTRERKRDVEGVDEMMVSRKHATDNLPKIMNG